MNHTFVLWDQYFMVHQNIVAFFFLNLKKITKNCQRNVFIRTFGKVFFVIFTESICWMLVPFSYQDIYSIIYRLIPECVCVTPLSCEKYLKCTVLESLKVQILPEQELETCHLITEHSEVEEMLSIKSILVFSLLFVIVSWVFCLFSFLYVLSTVD